MGIKTLCENFIKVNKTKNNEIVESYILATKGKSLISQIIKKYQRNYPYTHIAYVVDLNKDKNGNITNPIVIEAWHLPIKLYTKIFSFRIPLIKKEIELSLKYPKLKIGGVFKGYLSERHEPNTEFTIFRIPISKEQKEIIENFLNSMVERSKKGEIEYDLKGIFGFITYSNLEDKNKYFCSELVFLAYKKAGITLLRDIEPYKVSPRLFLLSPLLEKYKDGILKV